MIWNSEGGYYAGTSNVVLPVPNKQFFPAEFQNKSRLAYYASLFNSVEINSTFYKVPMASTIAKWAIEVPDTFRFTFKLWQDITHNAGLKFDSAAVQRFMNVISYAGDKKGCLLIQFPPSTNINLPQLQYLLSEIKHADVSANWPLAVEFRHRSWYNDDVYDLLDEHGVGMVLHDLPASAAPLRIGEADFVYLRFHGPNGGYRGSYADEFLYEYAQYIQEWMQDGKTVYAYFNNTMGEAVKNLQTLNNYMQES
ncbi:DUF72 domain-containing protein [Mucilaginibacter sp. Bleaf8]|uniref:DUF72 domain-containing protein n=1 Tax=Mucilaginibacter sp. Bleaf8 TaxID=2834430 RepID=UPI001BCE652E|nr:DUF72 domain-containing protein [Mucilaginibacter sp. Bleaf8]MBS7563601.1 DUF72 domain-containing protein [Mucilaginibacter sp. Bleaf8]